MQALLVIFYTIYGVTTATVPTDKCEIMAAQLREAARERGVYAYCIYPEPRT